MKAKELNSSEKKCRNCSQDLEADDNFCSNCGQSASGEEDIQTFFRHFLSDYFTFDSKIFRSIRPLFARPGFLSLEYLRGRRVTYIPPLRLFIFTSIFFFLLLNVLEGSSEIVMEDAEDQYWDRFFDSWLPKLFFLLSPLFALILSLLFKKRNGSMLIHFLFSLHFHATLFSAGSIYIILSWLLALLELQLVNMIMLSVFGLFLLIYLWRALINVYNENIFGTLWRYLLLALLYISTIGISMLILALLSR